MSCNSQAVSLFSNADLSDGVIDSENLLVIVSEPARDVKVMIALEDMSDAEDEIPLVEIKKKVKRLKREKKRLEALSVQEERNFGVVVEYAKLSPFKLGKSHFRCIVCNEAFLVFEEFKTHVASHCDDYVKVALKKIRSSQSLLYMEVSTISCRQCDEDFDCIDKFRGHVYEIHKQKQCSDQEFWGVILPFRNDKLCYECVICNNSFQYLSLLNQHFNEHFPNFACSDCGKTFMFESRLKKHIGLHHVDGEFACRHCDRVFTVLSKLRSHVGIVHSSATNTRRKRKMNKIKDEDELPTKKDMGLIMEWVRLEPFSLYAGHFICIVCKDKFVELDSLMSHLESHKDDDVKSAVKMIRSYSYVVYANGSSLKCMGCFEIFDGHERLKEHLTLVHNVDTANKDFWGTILPLKLTNTTFECYLCNNAFKNSILLAKHMNKHFANFKCEICGEPFVIQQRLTKHVRIVHRTKPVCVECNEVFSSAELLDSHLRSAHPDSVEIKASLDKYVNAGGKARHSTGPKEYGLLVQYAKLSPIKWTGKSFGCIVCPEKCPDLTAMKVHRKRHSDVDVTAAVKMMNRSDQRIYMDVSSLFCQQCEGVYDHVGQFKDHLTTVHQEDSCKEFWGNILPFEEDGLSFQCHLCTESFLNFSVFSAHLNTHFGKLTCDTCGKAFMSHTRLSKHVKYSHSVGEFTCKECGMTFTNLGQMTNHVEIRHKRQQRQLLREQCKASLLGQIASPKRAASTVAKKTGLVRPFPKNTAIIKEYGIVLEYAKASPFRWKNGRYVCATCDEKHLDLDVLNEHARLHDSEKVKTAVRDGIRAEKYTTFYMDASTLVCRICDTSIDNQDAFKQHLSDIHKLDVSNTDFWGVIKPFRTDKSSFVCYTCNESVLHFFTLIKHMNEHASFRCDECGKPYLTEHRLKGHMRRTHTVGEFPCTRCDRVFSSIGKKDSHIRTFHGGPCKIKCPRCPAVLKNFESKMRHLAEVHNQEGFRYKCKICPRRFMCAGSLTNHVNRVHLKLRNHTCEFCGKGFGKANNLRIHMVTHTGERNYICEICKKGFTRLNSLKEHLKIHFNIKAYVCTVCGKAFIQKATLKAHMNVHGKTLTCSDAENESYYLIIKADNEDEVKKKPLKPLPKVGTFAKAKRKIPLKSKVKSENRARKKSGLLLEYAKIRPIRSSHSVFLCCVCGEKCVDINSLEEHLKVHDDVGIKTAVKKLIDSDDIVCMNASSLTCVRCNQTLEEIDEFKEHISREHGANISKEFWGAVFPFRTLDSGFVCVVCEQHFCHFGSLNRHVNQHYANYVCNDCGKAFVALKRLKMHIRRLHMQGDFHCKKCNMTFTNMSRLDNHRRSFHMTACSFTSFDTVVGESEKLVMKKTPKRLRSYVLKKTIKDGLRSLILKKDYGLVMENAKLSLFRWNDSKFICCVCEDRFPSLNEFKVHLAVHEGENIEALVSDKYTSEQVLYMDISILICHKCGAQFSKSDEFKAHVIDEHRVDPDRDFWGIINPVLAKENTYDCHVCNESFIHFLILAKHMNSHADFKCDSCDKSFVSKSRLKRHMRRLHTQGEYPCKRCDKLFYSLAKLEYHVSSTHKKASGVRCPKCPMVLSNFEAKLRHLVEAHDEEPNRYKCGSCNKRFMTAALLSSHKRIHIKERKFICEICGLAFRRGACLRKHSVVHSDEKLFTCKVCSKMYSRSFTLREHMKIHDNVRRFKCPVCERAFVQKCSLKSHLNTHEKQGQI